MKTLRDKTGIEYLQFALDKDNKCPLLFEAAEMLQLGIIDEFSQWLVKEKYILNYLNGKLQKPKDEQRPMSEIYQMFIKSREA
jgi:hypothetical protein